MAAPVQRPAVAEVGGAGVKLAEPVAVVAKLRATSERQTSCRAAAHGSHRSPLPPPLPPPDRSSKPHTILSHRRDSPPSPHNNMPDEPSKPPQQTYAQAAAEGVDNPPPCTLRRVASPSLPCPQLTLAPDGQTDNSISVTGISNGKGDAAAAAAGAAGPSGSAPGPSTHVNAVQAQPPAPAAFTHPAARPHHPHPPAHARAHNHAHGHLGRHRDVEAGVVLFIPEREIALARAKRRFFGALCWALVIYLVLACVFGVA